MTKIRTIKNIICVLMILGANSTVAFAADNSYDYHPSSVLALGKGFEPNILSEPKIKCVDAKEVFELANKAATQTHFEMRTIRSVRKLKEQLGVDFKIDARYLNSYGGAQFNLDKESNFNSNSINILISASSEFGSMTLDNPKLKPFAQDLIDKGKHDHFRDECGSQLVVNAVYGVKVAVLLTIHNVSSTTSSNIQADAKGGYDGGAMKVDFKASLSDLVKQASATNSLSITVYSVGSQGVSDLSDVVKVMSGGEDSLGKIQEKIGSYFDEFTRDDAVPIRFVAKPFGFGFEDKYENLWKAHNERKISRIAGAYRRLQFQVEQVNAIEDGDDLRSLLVADSDLDQLIDRKDAAEDYMDTLANLHRSCQFDVYSQTKPDVSNGDTKEVFCNFQKSEVPYIDLPEIPKSPVLVKADQGEDRPNQLVVSGSGLKSITVYMVNDGQDRKMNQMKFDFPDVVESQALSVSIEKYWKAIKKKVKGEVRGYVVISDYFGRNVVYRFHHAGYSSLGGGVPYFDEFSPEGVEAVLEL